MLQPNAEGQNKNTSLYYSVGTSDTITIGIYTVPAAECRRASASRRGCTRADVIVGEITARPRRVALLILYNANPRRAPASADAHIVDAHGNRRSN